MPRLRWEKFWYGDWSSDASIRHAPLEVRGAWIEILCRMWHDRVSVLSGDDAFWAVLLGIERGITRALLDSLERSKIGEVEKSGENVTVMCRRLERMYKTRENNRLRVERHRIKSLVTPQVMPEVTGAVTDRSQKPEARERDGGQSSPMAPRDVHRSVGGLGEEPGGSSPGNGIPKILKGLELYEKDPRLCGGISQALYAWRKAYPAINMEAEIQAAHAWEVERPQQRKKNRIAFLGSWLKRSQKDVDQRARVSSSAPVIRENEQDRTARIAKEKGYESWMVLGGDVIEVRKGEYRTDVGSWGIVGRGIKIYGKEARP